MSQPKLIAIDFETGNSSGSALNYWEADFRVLSAAFAWFREDGSIGTRYLEGEEEIGEQLEIIYNSDIVLVAHNAAYDFGCIVHRYPNLPRNQVIDTMRLTQLYDNGGSRAKLQGPMSLEDEMAMLEGTLKVSSGLGLEAAVSRILPREYHNHKEPYYKWLRDNGVKKGQEGANLQLLPPDMLEAYNTMDAIVTLLLHKEITDRFAEEGFDWTFDHKLHFNEIKRVVAAKAKGILVARDELTVNADTEKAKIEDTKMNFLSTFAAPISDIEQQRWEAWVNELKTERGRQNRASQPMPEDLRFNTNSTADLKKLFIDVQGHKPVFFTKENKKSQEKRRENPNSKPYVPSPSMKAAHLPSYGLGGEILQNSKKRQLVALQMRTLLNKSAKDGRWHVDLNVCGTVTGRYTGGGGLNIQALARKEAGLMDCLIPDEGNEFSSIDLASGEPTVIAHYSGDRLYNAATFGMVGKKPYYDGDLLMIDSPYMMLGSIAPTGKDDVRRLWDEGKFEGWENFDDHKRKALWKGLSIHKTISLAKIYGQGARGTINFVSDFGYHLDYKTSQTLHHQFWYDLFPNVRMLGERLGHQFERQGYLYNQFGYRMVPNRPGLALNYTIQSSVSGIIKVLADLFFALAPWASQVTVIHDEIIIEYPIERREETRLALVEATKQLNDYLQWSVNIRTGWQTGENLYAAK